MSESSCMETIPCVKQGDAYDLRVVLELNGETVTAEDLPLLHCVEFMLGEGVRKVWPADGCFADGAFFVPLTQQDTFLLEEAEPAEFDVRVHFSGGAVVGVKKKLKVRICDALSDEVI